MRTTWIVCESSKKIPVWRKYGEGGKVKVKGAKFIYMGKGASFFPGGEIFRILGGREVGPVFAIKGCKRGGGGGGAAKEGGHWNTTEP